VINVSPAALATYERLREQVLSGQVHPEGLTAIVYHGMLRGLAVILTVVPAEGARAPDVPVLEAGPLDRELLRLLTNMVLQSQSQVKHVY
jgi:hypothetical protein